jgi:NnrS protein
MHRLDRYALPTRTRCTAFRLALNSDNRASPSPYRKQKYPPNWTGRLPVVGLPLLLLFLIWMAGRIAILVSGWVGVGKAAVIDLSFLAALGCVIGREIVASNNARNLKVLAIVGLLFAGNVAFHVEAAYGIGQGYGTRTGGPAMLRCRDPASEGGRTAGDGNDIETIEWNGQAASAPLSC